MIWLTLKQRSSKQDKIVGANMHLFYHPVADHICVIQANSICHELDRMHWEKNDPNPQFICQDFDSGLLSGEICSWFSSFQHFLAKFDLAIFLLFWV